MAKYLRTKSFRYIPRLPEICLSFLLLCGATNQCKATGLEVYLNAEKPGAGRSYPVNSSSPFALNLARDEAETITVRLPDSVSIGKYIGLDRFELKATGPKPEGLRLKAYVDGVHKLAKSSAKRGSAGEVVDILIPNELARQGAFKAPTENLPSRPVYTFDILAEDNAKPGTYDTELRFKANGGEYGIPLRIRIFSTTLPKRFELRTSFGFAPWGVLQKHYGAWNADELKLYRKYFALASEHRFDLHKIYLSLPKGPEATKSDVLAFSAAKDQAFTSLWNEVSSGELSPQGFRWATTDLPVPEDMKYPGVDPRANTEIEHYWRALNKSVVQHHLEEDNFVYFIDEPKKPVFPKIAQALKQIREWAPALRFLGTVMYDPKLEGTFNIWVANLFLWEQRGQPTPDFYRKRQLEKNDKVWLYIGCNSHGCDGPEDLRLPDVMIDRPAAYTLAFPLMAVRYQADGILYYDTVYNYLPGDPLTPWKDPFAFTGYGEGNLFYPCSPKLCGVSEQEALPSLRLKALRDGLEDAQLLLMARKKGLPVDEWVKQAIPNVRAFPLEASAYEELKLKALEGLEPR